LLALVILTASCQPTVTPTASQATATPSDEAYPPPTIGAAATSEAYPQPEATAASQPPATLTVMTHDSFAASDAVIAAFEAQYNTKVQILLSGDTGSALNKAILSKGNPLADVFYGVDNTFLGRALSEDIFEAYESPLLASIPAEFQLDPQKRALPVDYGDVCLNYDKAYFTDLTPPASLEDLLEPEYKGLLVVENPATSSPGLAFLLATVGHFGPDGYLDFWAELRLNDVKVVDGWETAYYTEFTRAGGMRPIVVSYSSSPAYEVQDPALGSPTAAVVADDTCFRQVEFVGILKGTQNRSLAEKWVDFMLSTAFQEDMPGQMYVFPVNPEAKLDALFTQFLVNPQKPAFVSPEDIAANRQQWIEAWTETVLR
jgi:thiamine transport system substrate-binding protein